MTHKYLSGPAIHFVCFDDCTFSLFFSSHEWNEGKRGSFVFLVSSLFSSDDHIYFYLLFLFSSSPPLFFFFAWSHTSLESWVLRTSDDVMRKRLHSGERMSKHTRTEKNNEWKRGRKRPTDQMTWQASPDFICLHHPSLLLFLPPTPTISSISTISTICRYLHTPRRRRKEESICALYSLSIKEDSHEMILIASRASSFDAGKHDYIS